MLLKLWPWASRPLSTSTRLLPRLGLHAGRPAATLARLRPPLLSSCARLAMGADPSYDRQGRVRVSRAVDKTAALW